MVVRLALLVLVPACRIGFDATARDAGADEAALDASADAAPAPNLVFVSSTTVDLCASGVAAADAECAARATAAGLAGTYVSWTSDATSDAIDRIGSARGWVRKDGRAFAATGAQLTTVGPWFPPSLDENGNDVGPELTASATDADGRLTGFSPACQLGGRATTTRAQWFNGFVVAPGQRVVCLGVDRQVDVAPVLATGRFAFATSGDFAANSGVGAADTLCGTEATAASLPGTYKAFMSTMAVQAASRFNLGGAAWVRTDGVPAVTTAADLGTWTLLTSIDRHADGTPATSYAWTGNPTTNTQAMTCNDWTTNQMSVMGVMHQVVESDGDWTTLQNGCATLGKLICLQE